MTHFRKFLTFKSFKNSFDLTFSHRKAAQIVPSNGQPYNQLAILASPQSDLLSTVFFYLRAIYVKCPFPGSKLNLERTLEKGNGWNDVIFQFLPCITSFNNFCHLLRHFSISAIYYVMTRYSLQTVLKTRPKPGAQKQSNKISVLELIRLFLKFHATIYTSTPELNIDQNEFRDLYMWVYFSENFSENFNFSIFKIFRRLIGAIEVHLSLGGLSRRQLLQITFISIVNLHKSHLESNQFAIRLGFFALWRHNW